MSYCWGLRVYMIFSTTEVEPILCRFITTHAWQVQRNKPGQEQPGVKTMSNWGRGSLHVRVCLLDVTVEVNQRNHKHHKRKEKGPRSWWRVIHAPLGEGETQGEGPDALTDQGLPGKQWMRERNPHAWRKAVEYRVLLVSRLWNTPFERRQSIRVSTQL